MEQKYIVPTEVALNEFLTSNMPGPIVMLNLLRFRQQADYTAAPQLATSTSISGEEAYRVYIETALPILLKQGGEIIFRAKGGNYLIGPGAESWDEVLLIRYPGIHSFKGFITDPGYIDIVGHRTAALAESRLLPMTGANGL